LQYPNRIGKYSGAFWVMIAGPYKIDFYHPGQTIILYYRSFRPGSFSLEKPDAPDRKTSKGNV